MRKLLLALALSASLALSAPAWADTGSESDASDSVSSGGAGSGTAPTAVDSAMIASGSIKHCSGYVYMTSISSSGHTLETRSNTCGVYYGSYYKNGVLLYRWGPVTRLKCYRDGIQFGDATGGCRWKGSLSTYHNGGHRWTHAYARPGSVSSAFWDDSGRIYGGYFDVPGSTTLKYCNDDWGYDVGGLGAAYNGVVHFMGATGIDYGTYNMLDKCSPTFNANSI